MNLTLLDIGVLGIALGRVTAEVESGMLDKYVGGTFRVTDKDLVDCVASIKSRLEELEAITNLNALLPMVIRKGMQERPANRILFISENSLYNAIHNIVGSPTPIIVLIIAKPDVLSYIVEETQTRYKEKVSSTKPQCIKLNNDTEICLLSPDATISHGKSLDYVFICTD